ncbi:MAG: diguanylate cyclase [Candidatus Eremiobacteraeota bacterium]|nr:diguanylate cyclase [Candidatus Eremiobacteraeota bacterium]
MAKVLVVDDVPDNIKLLTYELADQGHDVFIAEGGPKALELARSERPDVVLLDIMMPEMDGIEVLQRLKSQTETKLIPVILVSAKDLDEDVIRGLDSGAMDYVTKPFSTRIVAARVRSAVRIKRMNDLLTEKARVDELTGLFNRAHFDDLMEQSLERVRRYGAELSLLMVRLDNLGDLNNRFGHAVGDKVLREVSQTVERTARKVDVVCRIEGAEIALLLPDLEQAAAEGLAERLRRRISVQTIKFSDDELQTTASLGLATTQKCPAESEAFVEAATFALYAAREAGGNRVFAWSGEGAEEIKA